MTKSIATNYGEAVQLRINGVQATHEEVVALRPEDVIRVEYHEQPGLRYGGAAAVIDYIVKRKESGGNVSADLTNGVSPLGFGNYHLSGKYHQGKSTFTALMQWSRRDLEWNRENEETFYYPVPSRVIQSEAKNLDDIKVDVLEILRRFAPLDDKEGYVVHNREVVASPNRIKYDYSKAACFISF